MIKEILIFAGGVTVGVLASYTYFKKKYEDICDEEVESVKEAYRGHTDVLNKHIEKIESEKKEAFMLAREYKKQLSRYGYDVVQSGFNINLDDIPEDPEEKEIEIVEKTVENIGYDQETPHEDYDPVESLYPTEDDEDEFLYNEGVKLTNEYNNRNKFAEPCVITYDEFAEEHPEYDKLTITYYEDGTVCNEDDSFMDDVDGNLGECLGEFEFSDADVIYVRNEARAIDFEVIKVEESYPEAHGEFCD